MTEAKFRATVKEMRNAQNQYFRTKSIDWLKESKKLEAEVDKELSNQIHLPL